MVGLLLVIALLAGVDQDPSLTRDVDLIELNHYYDPSGRLVFDQYIFYDWDMRNSRHQVAFWRLAKLKLGAFKMRKDWVNDRYIMTFKEYDKIITIRALIYRETWTKYDPELRERDYLQKERRRGLFKKENHQPP